jgi:23S rRNA pseudouridine2605 synthase
MISAGRVLVNDVVIQKQGVLVDPARDAIKVDGKLIDKPVKPLYLMLNKPAAVMTTVSDEHGRKTVMSFLGRQAVRGPQRVFHVGRLDYQTEGLLLFTNDGELAMTLTHPSSNVPKVYQARVQGHLSENDILRLVHGLQLEDGPACALDAQVMGHNQKSDWVEITVVEGRNRLVRRMIEKIGHRVQRLIRVEYGGISLDKLPSGKARELTFSEVATLKRWTRARP